MGLGSRTRKQGSECWIMNWADCPYACPANKGCSSGFPGNSALNILRLNEKLGELSPITTNFVLFELQGVYHYQSKNRFSDSYNKIFYIVPDLESASITINISDSLWATA